MAGEVPGGAGGVLASFGAGSYVAGYRLEEQIGRGGMAVVFRARDERLQRLVALKILAPALASDEAFRRRFIRESRSAAAVDDPHIIPVFEAGEAAGVLFIAMRYVPGGDVRTLVGREGPLAPGRAASIVSAVASALDAAHAAGLVHRDVKPANMLVDARPGRPDHVYLSDFGLTKGTLASAGLTGTGQFLGTLDYCAPEQIEARQVDGRTDEYSLACAAFELLSGRPPFAAAEGLAVAYAQLSTPPPLLSSRRPGFAAAADDVLVRAMAKAPQDRYASCRDFADALRAAFGLPSYDSDPQLAVAPVHPATEAAYGSAVAAPRRAATVPRRGTRRRTGLAIFCALAVLVAAGAVGAIIASSRGPGFKPPSSPSAGRRSATDRPGGTGPTSFGLANTLNPGTGSRGINALAFNPDGKMLAAAGRSGSIFLWDPASGNRLATLTDPASRQVLAVAMSPDGKILAAGDGNHHIYLWNPITRTLVTTLTDPDSRGVYAVAFSPDGKTLAAGDGNHHVYLWNPVSGAWIATLADPGSRGIDALAFSPDGNTLAAGDYNGTTYLWQVAARALIASLVIPSSSAHDVLAVAFSPDGRTLATGSFDGSTYLWRIATHGLAATFPDPDSGAVESVAFSPDGGALAAGDEYGNTYVWHVTDGGLIATLPIPSPAPRSVWAVTFSPNGKFLAAGDHGGAAYLWKTG